MKRIKYDRKDVNDALRAAVELTKNGGTLYVFATYYGFAVHPNRPPVGQSYYVVKSGKAYKRDMTAGGGVVISAGHLATK